MIVRADDPLAGAVIRALKEGDLESLQKLIDAHPGLPIARLRDARGSKTLLHVVTDWPGFFPNGPSLVKRLIAAGANPDARTEGGPAPETPLHWAASSDDVEVAEALVDGGADIAARGGSIAGGTALENAVGYGCWRVARLLLNCGAHVEKLWHAAGLGMTARVEQFFQASSPPSLDEVNSAFWQACHGGHRRTAEYLLARGAELNGAPPYARQTPLGIASSGGLDTGRRALVEWLRSQGAHDRAQ